MGGTNAGWRLTGCALAWLLGVALQLQERSLSPSWVYPSAFVAALVCAGIARRWPRVWQLALVAALLAGAGASGWRAGERLAQQLPSHLEGEDIQIEGVIASL